MDDLQPVHAKHKPRNSLREDFDLRKKFFTNRASAVFPIFFRKIDNDLFLVWLNYWTIKNHIDINSILVNLRIYDTGGDLITRAELKLHDHHNQVSIRDYISSVEFYGMVEIEIISTSNLKFVFPAISAVFRSGNYFSGVHSAGRIKGTDENQTPTPTEETNWSCKFNDQTTPFFHYINGTADEVAKLTITLYSSVGETLDQVNLTENFSAFGSKIYWIDEFFPASKCENGTFVGVKCFNNSVFRRMVVGNYHKDINHLEVTHSFPWQEKVDLCATDKNGFESFLAMYTHEKLNLSCRVFPTNCDGGEFVIEQFEQKFSDNSLRASNDKNPLQNDHGTIVLPDDTKFKLLGLRGAVPSRFNTNFIYNVKGPKNRFSTDIATGAKSCVYPPKHTHWGFGLFGSGYDFVVMIRNNNHERNSVETCGSISFYGFDQDMKFPISISAESSINFCLSDEVSNISDNVNGEARLFTWLLNLNQPSSETFWVSWRRSDGCIFGCHGF